MGLATLQTERHGAPDTRDAPRDLAGAGHVPCALRLAGLDIERSTVGPGNGGSHLHSCQRGRPMTRLDAGARLELTVVPGRLAQPTLAVLQKKLTSSVTSHPMTAPSRQSAGSRVRQNRDTPFSSGQRQPPLNTWHGLCVFLLGTCSTHGKPKDRNSRPCRHVKFQDHS